jgi:sporulation integral membrane protein YlbJ
MPVNYKKQRLQDAFVLCGFLLCGAGLLCYSKAVSAAMTQALALCVQVLLPSLFPFFVLSSMVISTGVIQRLSPRLEKPFQWLFGLPGSFGAALLLGAAGGYPVGAKTIATLYQQGQCSKSDAEKALRFCNNAGPAFLISAVGASLLQDPHAGLNLYAVHVLSALIIGFIYRKNTDNVKYHCITADHMRSTATISLFLRAVTDAFSSFLNVSAFVLIFSVISTMLQQLPLIDSLHCLPGGGILWYGLLAGFLELTSGVACLTQGGLPPSSLLPALSFLCGWGGCSVQFQTISLLHDAGLSCRQYLKSKLLQGILAALITGMICF